MRAIILAGGKGTRLRPYTVVLPKPLMPIGEYPILEVIVRQLVYYGFTHITMAVNHQAKIIQSFFGNGEQWGITIDYSLEEKPLSTMGPLRLIKNLPENFLVMNGDILTDLNFREFFKYHVDNGNNFTIAAFQRVLKSEYGVLNIDNGGKLCGFVEKPEYRFDVSMGIYAVNLEVMRFIPEETTYGFDHLMLDLLANGKPASVKRHDGHWLDIGRPEDYMQALEEFESQKDIYFKM